MKEDVLAWMEKNPESPFPTWMAGAMFKALKTTIIELRQRVDELSGVKGWNSNRAYATGDIVAFSGARWRSKSSQNVNAAPGYSGNEGLWERLNNGNASAWQPDIFYNVGDVVTKDGLTYQSRMNGNRTTPGDHDWWERKDAALSKADIDTAVREALGQ